MPDNLKYHENCWLVYQDRLHTREINTRATDPSERAHLRDMQKYHEDRYCELSGDAMLNQLNLHT